MATITITAPIDVCDDETSEEIIDPARLRALDGAEEKGAKLADYLDGEPRLAHLGLAGGDLKLRFDPRTSRLLVVSSYQSPQRLSAGQLKALVAYTRAQWSDGAGEGAFSKLMVKHSVGIDLTPRGSERQTRVLQTDAGGGKLKPTPALAVAAEKGDLAKVLKLLAGGADINTRGKYRQTALQKAILYDHFKLAALLIDRGADLHAADEHGETPLVTAVTSGHLATVKRLIKAGADVNRANKEGVTPLMWAVNYGHAAIAKLLLAGGADPNAQNNEGRTPLMYTHSQPVIEVLLAHGARSNERDRAQGNAVDHALTQARAFERFGDRREAAKWRKLAEQLSKHVK